VLTADLVRVRKHKGALSVPPLKPAQRARSLAVAQAYVALALDHVGRSRGELEEAWDAVPHSPTDYKLVKGLRKLLADRCEFTPPAAFDPIELRRALFSRAAAARAALADDARFDRDAVVRDAAAELGLDCELVADGLFSDLKEHHRLMRVTEPSGAALVERYELAQEQAVLLRAVRVTIDVAGADPGAYRRLFRALKFRRLLYRVRPRHGGGFSIEVDGPLSLFQSVTKYGLQLALLVPALRELGAFRLEADVRWSKGGEPLRYCIEGDAPERAGGAPLVADELAALRADVDRLDTPWRTELADEIVDLPGVGVCVPDLVFVHAETGQRVLLELLGYWSRDAVWRRVELVEAGLDRPIVFALSSRLRVSDEVLPADLPGQLYVYKGVISARAVLERIERAAAAVH
jgi:hypothetical protein